jgi:hypothetical protein
MTPLHTQAARDAAPTVAPVEGRYALLRNGEIGLVKPPRYDPSLDPYFVKILGSHYPIADYSHLSSIPSNIAFGLEVIATYTPAQLLAPRSDHTCLVQVERVARAIVHRHTEDWATYKGQAIAALKAMETPL